MKRRVLITIFAVVACIGLFATNKVSAECGEFSSAALKEYTDTVIGIQEEILDVMDEVFYGEEPKESSGALDAGTREMVVDGFKVFTDDSLLGYIKGEVDGVIDRVIERECGNRVNALDFYMENKKAIDTAFMFQCLGILIRQLPLYILAIVAIIYLRKQKKVSHNIWDYCKN